MATQEQRTAATKAQLIRAFRAAFLRRGYEATTTQAVLSETGLSKGAMYHHFRSKAEIMEAIYAEESRRTLDRALRASAKEDAPLDRLRTMCVAWLSEVRSKSVSTILFDIGPAVLGHEKAREIEDGQAIGVIENLLRQSADAGEIEGSDLALTASFISALVGEAAIHRRRTGSDSAPALRKTVDAVISGLRAPA